jgi:hypothetical protein
MYLHVVAARSDVGPRVTRVLGIVVGLMWGLGQDTLLGIVVGLCGASSHTLCCWSMCGLGQHTLLGIVVGYVAPRATHFTGYCCWFLKGLGQHITVYCCGLC